MNRLMAVPALCVLASAAACKNQTSTLQDVAPSTAQQQVQQQAQPLPTHNGGFDPMSCDTAGPQTPRDVSGVNGTNNRTVPGSQRTTSTAGMRICSVHFHRYAEHKSRGQYDVDMGGQGFACSNRPAAGQQSQQHTGGTQTGVVDPQQQTVPGTDEHVLVPGGLGVPVGHAEIVPDPGMQLTEKQHAQDSGHAAGHGSSHGGSHGGSHSGIQVGDTVEFHWVHTTCSQQFIDNAIAEALRKDPSKDTGLGPCACPGGQVVVEARVFRVSADTGLESLTNRPVAAAGGLVKYFGSTTGPKYNNQCSPVQAGWSVDPQCQELRLSALESWLAGDAKRFNESHAHGVRELITDPAKLAPFE